MENSVTLFHTKMNDGKDQWWHLSIPQDFISIDSVITHYTIRDYPIRIYLEKLSQPWNHYTITAIPLISKNSNINSNVGERGSDDDPDPFIYRKKELPRLKAIIREDTVYFSTNEYGRSLTDGQRGFLNQNFSEQLQSSHTKEHIEFMQKMAKQTMFNGFERDMYALKDQIKRFESMIDKIQKEID